MSATALASELRCVFVSQSHSPRTSSHTPTAVTRRLVLGTPTAVAHASHSTNHSDSQRTRPSGERLVPEHEAAQDDSDAETRVELRRRDSLLCALACALAPLPVFSGAVAPPPAEAREKRQKTNFAEEDYVDAGNGLRYLEIESGKGKTPEDGEQVKVHFEVRYGPLTVVSTRESKLLGGNRSISQPYLFVLGAPPGAERRRDKTENANGLFSAQAAPKPPRALYAAVNGMKIGGKRAVLVPADQAYGDKGYNEIPPCAQIQLIIDLLDFNDTE